jgi:hypothetical protein
MPKTRCRKMLKTRKVSAENMAQMKAMTMILVIQTIKLGGSSWDTMKPSS